jgi:hypothetical protein
MNGVCNGPVGPLEDVPLYGGLDLSEVSDLEYRNLVLNQRVETSTLKVPDDHHAQARLRARPPSAGLVRY